MAKSEYFRDKELIQERKEKLEQKLERSIFELQPYFETNKVTNTGRKTKITPLSLAKFEIGLKQGLTIDQACFLGGFSPSVLRDWLIINPEYKERRDILLKHTNMTARKKVNEAIAKDKDGEFSLKYLERTDEDFNPKKRTEQTNLNINLSDLLQLADGAGEKKDGDINENPQTIIDVETL